MLETIWIAFAFFLGLLVRSIGLPPLIGYLAAGFAISASGGWLDIPAENGPILQYVSHLGVLLLLFSVGLKLRARTLLRPEVLASGTLHFAITCALFAPALYWTLEITPRTALLLAAALAFSSTVLTAKVLDSKRELRAFHGRTAVGILVVQDLLALLVISVAGGTLPSPWALLIFLIPLTRPFIYRLLNSSGHDELLILLGLLLALVVGGHGFELIGLSSELGALAFGALLANHPRATELSNALWGVKEVFLVGFFLQIGIGGLPDSQAVLFALTLVLVLALKGLLFFALLLIFKLRSRSAFLTSLSLTNYSEFGLIIASILLPAWLTPLALTVALSFVVSAPLNRIAHPLYERLASRLAPLERDTRHPDEQPISLGDTEILIMGMGRAGTAAYDHLADKQLRVLGMDSDPAKVTQNQLLGRNCVFADAEDQVFWQNLDLTRVKAAVLCMGDVEAKTIAARQLRHRGFSGYIISHTLYSDEASQIDSAGANQTYLTMNETGISLAEHVQDYLKTI